MASERLTFDDLKEITEKELRKPVVQEELNQFLDEVYPEEDFLSGMPDWVLEREMEAHQ